MSVIRSLKVAMFPSGKLHIVLSFLTLAIHSCSSSAPSSTAIKKPKIAVVGAGIGGASVVYHLEKFFGPEDVHIDVFEPHNIGGRLATVKVDGSEFELGGSIIHPRNRLMKEFVDLLGLEHKAPTYSSFALFDGKEIVYVNSEWTLVSALKMLSRYGLGTFFLNRVVEALLSKFDRIYPLMDSGNHYPTTTELLHAMSPEFVDHLQVTAGQAFKEIGFDDTLVNELILATLAVNYGQTLDVHKFVGSVSIAGVVGELYGIKGGNRQVPEGLLQRSRADIKKAKVTNISLLEDNNFMVHYEHSITQSSSQYNIVILALPLAENVNSDLRFENFPHAFSFPGNYHQTVCTIVSGNLNYSYFGVGEHVTEIFSLDDSLFFSSVSHIEPVDGPRPADARRMWKVFSHQVLSRSQLSTLFLDRGEVKSKKWLAYPHYSTTLRSDSFILHKNLFHVNGVEWAASAMEMSAIGGKNVALMAYESWTGRKYQPDTKPSREEL